MAAPFNKRGNRENLSIVDFHDQLMARHGASWREPSVGNIVWQPEDEALALCTIAPVRASNPWGFKDPRTLLLLDGWLRLFPKMRLVGIFRNPSAVCKSLSARGGSLAVDHEAGERLWVHYNRLLLDIMHQHDAPLLSFDVPQVEFDTRVNGLCDAFGLSENQGTFFTSELRNDVVLNEEIHEPETLALYQSLRFYYEQQV